jgi:hypothetical protein
MEAAKLGGKSVLGQQLQIEILPKFERFGLAQLTHRLINCITLCTTSGQ